MWWTEENRHAYISLIENWLGDKKPRQLKPARSE